MPQPDRETLAAVTSRFAELDSGAAECGYLANRIARHRYYAGVYLRGAEYGTLLDANFRRAGYMFYRPQCDGCAACRQLRVLVEEFEPSRSQRRCLRRNADLEIAIAPPAMDAERVELYERYVTARHGGVKQDAAKELESFLYRTAVPTVEIAYRTSDRRLVGVSIVDVGPGFLSSVYHYFDPAAAARSIGVFSVLAELRIAKQRGLAHYYLGYLVAESPKMSYKADYRPFELLVDSEWRRVDHGDVLP